MIKFESILEKANSFLSKKKPLTAIFIAIIVAFFSYQASKLQVDNSLKVWFAENDPALLSYYSFLDKFGSDEVIITVINDSRPYYDSLRIQNSIELTHQIERIGGVSQVKSIANTPLSYSSKSTTIEDYIKKGLSKERTAYFIDRIENSKINSLYIGKNNTTTVFYTWVDTLSNIDLLRGHILDEISKQGKASLLSRKGNIQIGGVGVLFEALNRITINEGAILILLSYLLLVVCVYIATRSSVLTFATILVVTFASITMFGFMGLFGRSINMVTLALPPLLMVVSVSNMIHITQHLRYTNQNSGAKKFIFINSLALISVPILFNAFTTASGFFSLSTASMAITRDYGLFAAIGILSVLFFSLIISIFIGKKNFIKHKSYKGEQRLSSLLKLTFAFSLKNKMSIVGLSIVLVLVSIIGIIKIDADTFTMDFLPTSHKVRHDDKAIQKAIGPYIPLEFVIELKDKNWKNAKFVNALNKLQLVLEEDKDIASSFSLANIVVEANNYRPLSQYKLLLFSSRLSKDPSFNRLIANKGKDIRLTLNVSMSSARKFDEIATKVIARSQPLLSDYGKISKGGYLPLYSSIISQTLNDQARSLSVAFILIMVLILLILKSLKFTLLAIPSNILPILFILSFMGFFGIRLDIATITVAATVMGIIVDDSIHILYNLKKHLSNGKSIDDALNEVAQMTGKAVVISSAIIVAGYSIVAFGNVKLISNSSLLMILTIIFALLTDLFLLPALAGFVFKSKH